MLTPEFMLVLLATLQLHFLSLVVSAETAHLLLTKPTVETSSMLQRVALPNSQLQIMAISNLPEAPVFSQHSPRPEPVPRPTPSLMLRELFVSAVQLVPRPVLSASGKERLGL